MANISLIGRHLSKVIVTLYPGPMRYINFILTLYGIIGRYRPVKENNSKRYLKLNDMANISVIGRHFSKVIVTPYPGPLR